MALEKGFVHNMVTFTLALEERGRTIQMEKMELAFLAETRQMHLSLEMLDRFAVTVTLDDLSRMARDEPRRSRFGPN